MLFRSRYVCFFALVASIWAAPPGIESDPAVSLTARLLTPLSSYHSKHGEAVEAEISSPMCMNGAELPADTAIRGVVRRVHRVGLGLVHETASLDLDFETMNLADGRSFPVDVRLTSVDNARERVDGRGVIRGIRSTDTLSSRFAARLFFAAHAHPALLIPSLAIESWMFRFPDPEIAYEAGTEIQLRVHFPSELGSLAACTQPGPVPEHSEELEQLASGLPAWSYSRRQRQPIDRVNLVFVGSRDEVESAFRAAGWIGSQPNSLWTGFQAVRAIVEDQRYSDAPMRTLLLDGAEPDLRLQKSLNTFDKRDHLRIWQRPEEWQGHTVWASAATQDVAATFGMHPFGFTHRIESNVDLERAKVVRDLELTGCVDSVLYSGVRPSPAEPLRKGVETDSRIAIVLFNSCETPRQWSTADIVDGHLPWEVRVVRRFILTARNHFIRDNYVWRGGESAKIGWHAFRGWELRRRGNAGVQRGGVDRAERHDRKPGASDTSN